MATVSQARLGEWFEQVRAEHVAKGMKRGMKRGLKQGMERGLEQGIEQERTRGLARLRRQAAIRFGAQTAERLSDLLGAAVVAEQMEHLGDQVSEWMVECECGEELLSRVSALVGNGDTGR